MALLVCQSFSALLAADVQMGTSAKTAFANPVAKPIVIAEQGTFVETMIANRAASLTLSAAMARLVQTEFAF